MPPVTNPRLFAIVLIASAACFFSSCGEKETPETETATEAANAVAADASVTEKETVQQDSPESLTDEFVLQMDLSLDAMLSAKDKVTADEASKKIFSIGDNIVAIAARLDKLETSSEEEKRQLLDKSEVAFKLFIQKANSPAMGDILNDPEILQALAPAREHFSRSMQKFGIVFARFSNSSAEAPNQETPASE